MAVGLLLLLVLEGRPASADDPLRAPSRSPGQLQWRIGRTPEVHEPNAPYLISTRIGGWADASYQNNDLHGESPDLNLNHFNVYLDTRYRGSFQLFFEGEFENEPGTSGYEEETEWEVEQVYFRYRRSDQLQVRIGTFNTPFGYWIPAHWSILMDTIQPPIFEGNEYIPEQQIGGELSGRLFPRETLGSESQLVWSLYAGYGNDSSLFDGPGSEGLSYGADLRTLLLGDRYLIGSSFYVQENREEDDRSERNLMLYGQAQLPWGLTFRGEYLHQARDRHTRPSQSKNIQAAYVKLRWDFRSDSYLNYRYDFGDDDVTGSTVEARIHAVTLGYRPLPPVRIKLEWSSHRFRDDPREDFNFWGASIGYLF